MFSPSFIVILPFFITSGHARNDWSVPCFGGECSYDLPGSSEASGSLKIWGSPNAITDITKAAGWTILNCDENAMAQDIRLVCNSDDAASSGCDHLFQNGDPVGKIVRLPDNCGASPFARIAGSWVHEDQSIPPSVSKTLVRRAESNSTSKPEVRGLTLDTNFAAVDPSQSGNVNIVIEGSNVPGETGNLTITPPNSLRRSRFARRAFFSPIEGAFNKFNSFDKNLTKALPPIDVDKSFPIFEDSVSCGKREASIKIDGEAKAHSVITLGIAAAGTIVPPKLTEFGIFVNMDADLTGSITLQGAATGAVDSGRISLFEVPIPGLDISGILSVGPSFKIEGQAKATLDIDVDMTVDLSYSVTGAKLFFPASQNHESGGNFVPGHRPLKLSVSPDLASKGVIEAHLIPKLDLDISVLDGAAEATVFIELDSSASANLALNAGASADVTRDDGKTTASSSGGVDGCANVDGEIAVNAGADGDFFGIFDGSTTVHLFSKQFNIFQKCFGTGATRRQVRSPALRSRGAQLSTRALSCPATGSASLVDLSA